MSEGRYVVLVGNPGDGFKAYLTDDPDFDRDLFEEWWLLPIEPWPEES